METLKPSAPLRRKRSLRGVTTVLLISVAVAGLLFAAATFAQKREASPTANGEGKATVTAQPPVMANLRTVTALAQTAPGETQELSGLMEARHTVTVSAEVAARIVSRPVERGDALRKGDPVAVLDDRTARATVAEASAALSAAVATRQAAESDYDRAQTETASAIDGAEASLSAAAASEKKARDFTRSQELRQAEAALSQARSDENLARIERDRYARLVREGAVAQQILDRAQATFEVAAARVRGAREGVSLAKEGARKEDIAGAAAQVRGAQATLDAAKARPARLAAIKAQIAALRAAEGRAAANLDAAQVQLSKHRIASPIEGRVLQTGAERGEMASPGLPLATVSDVRDLRAVFAVPEAARPLLSVGRRVVLSTDALPGKTFPARVAVLGFSGDNKTRTFRMEVAVSNPGETLLPNMTARLSLPVGRATRRVTVPLSAIATDRVTGNAYVVLLNENTPTRQAVTLGEPVGTDAVQIVRGLAGGEKLAADPNRVQIR